MSLRVISSPPSPLITPTGFLIRECYASPLVAVLHFVSLNGDRDQSSTWVVGMTNVDVPPSSVLQGPNLSPLFMTGRNVKRFKPSSIISVREEHPDPRQPIFAVDSDRGG